MDIKTMICRHQELIDTLAGAIKKEKFDEALIQRPIEMQEARATSVKSRIEALEAARSDYVARVDRDIKVLKSELSAVENRIKTERERVATILKAPAATKRPAQKK